MDYEAEYHLEQKDAYIDLLIDLLTRCRGAVKGDLIYWRQANHHPLVKDMEVARAAALLDEVDKVIGEDK